MVVAKADPKAILEEARAFEAKGDNYGAARGYALLATYLRKAGRLADARKLFSRAIRLAPQSARLHLQLAICEAASGKRRDAMASVRRFSELALRKKKTKEYDGFVETLLGERPELREVYYQTTLSLDRTDPTRFLALGRALQELGRIDEAMQSGLDALKTKSCDDVAISFLRDLVILKNDSRAQERIASFLDGKLSRENLISLLGGGSEEKSVVEQVAQMPGEDERSLRDLIVELENDLGVKLEDSTDSVEPLLKEFRKRSSGILRDDSKTKIDLALAFSEMGFVKDACEELESIKFSDPHYLEAQCLLGNFLMASGSELAALDIFQKCRRDDRASQATQCEARYRIGQIYNKLGDNEKALVELLEVEKCDPAYRDVRQLKLAVETAVERKMAEQPGKDSKR